MKKLLNRNVKGSFFLACLVAVAVIFGMGAWREVVDITNLFTNQIRPIGAGTTMTIGHTGDSVTITGDIAISKMSTTTGMSDYTLAATAGNIILVDFGAGATGTEIEKASKKIYLPPITAALDGYRVAFKNIISTGTTGAAVISATTSSYYGHGDFLETVPGTTSGNTLRIITGNSGVSEWIADYVSGSTGVWRLVDKL